MKSNDKYSTKIINFIDNNLTEFNNIINPILENIRIDLFNDMLALIASTFSTNYNYNSRSFKLLQIHKVDQYPLLFIFFCKLYETYTLNNDSINNNHVGNTDKIYCDMSDICSFPDICNFSKFVKWYRTNQTVIDFQSIHDYINKLDPNTELNNELLDLYKLIYNTKDQRSDLHELLYNNKFVSLDIQHHAESINLMKTVYETKEFNLSIYYPNTGLEYISDIDKIIHIIIFMNNLGKLNNSTNIPDICIFSGLQRKQFSDDDDDNDLCPDNINSGSSVRGKYVKIWRNEEINKVLIHELIHFHRLDFHSYNDGYNILSDYLINTYNIDGTDSPNESYTETLAVIIHSLFVSYYHKQSIYEILRHEMIFTLFQISKILTYFNIVSTNQLGYKTIKQTTSVFSYFIVKGSFLISLPLYLDFVKHDIVCLSIENKVEAFMKLVKLCMNKDYFKLVDKMIKMLLNINIDYDCFVMKTLRMTCHQI